MIWNLSTGAYALTLEKGTTENYGLLLKAAKTPTGIDDVQRSMNDAPAIYDLLGRKVNAVKKGLYIINGKKVIVK